MAFDSQPCDGKLEILHYKDGWNQNAPLSRASFDLTPFCSINYGGVKPPTNYASTCNVPAKSGYHVILAVWEVADTANAFYNVIDVDFGGGGTPNPGVPAPTGLTSQPKPTTVFPWHGLPQVLPVTKSTVTDPL